MLGLGEGRVFGIHGRRMPELLVDLVVLMLRLQIKGARHKKDQAVNKSEPMVHSGSHEEAAKAEATRIGVKTKAGKPRTRLAARNRANAAVIVIWEKKDESGRGWVRKLDKKEKGKLRDQIQYLGDEFSADNSKK